ncbi:hypothetical protein BDF22DRAFT_112252 [Syncephalis plumigaleata]|nr:hypothetical protein BDF22DRAFT_112252 [Syncephalis plumigaleata]
MQPKNNLRTQLNWYQKTIREKPTAQRTNELINQLKDDYEHVYKLYQEKKNRTQLVDSVKGIVSPPATTTTTVTTTATPIHGTNGNSHISTGTVNCNQYSTELPRNMSLESSIEPTSVQTDSVNTTPETSSFFTYNSSNNHATDRVQRLRAMKQNTNNSSMINETNTDTAIVNNNRLGFSPQFALTIDDDNDNNNNNDDDDDDEFPMIDISEQEITHLSLDNDNSESILTSTLLNQTTEQTTRSSVLTSSASIMQVHHSRINWIHR